MDATTKLAEPKSKHQVARILEHNRWRAQLDKQGYCDDRLEHIGRILNLVTACRTGWLGSHLYTCKACDRRLAGMNSCNNPHCPVCGQGRRDQWREDLIKWSLDCNYFHVVFTLPHDINPLIYCNSRALYKLLLSIANKLLTKRIRKIFGCTPGMVLILHTWGQRLNLHVHVHIILTAGGLSLDGKRWVAIDDEKHPAMQADELAKQFKKMYLRKLKWMVNREQLTWPTVDQLPTSYEALGMASHEQMLQFVDRSLGILPGKEGGLGFQPGKECIKPSDEDSTAEGTSQAGSAGSLGHNKLRPLSTIESSFFKHLNKKTWIAHSQWTPPHLRGAEQIINYLSHYVSGSVIGDHRIIDVDDQSVSYRWKDYKAGDVKEKTEQVGEFVRRWVMHILPKHLSRVRYSGIFAGCERQKRLVICRQLIGESQSELTTTDEPCALETTPPFELEDEYIEDEPPLPKCHCRYCKGDMELIGQLPGTETQAMRRLSQDIVFHVTAFLFPIIGEDNIKHLFIQLRSAWITRRWLPSCIRHLFTGKRLTSIECGILEAFVTDELRLIEKQRELESTNLVHPSDMIDSSANLHRSGIPPPIQLSASLPLEPHHAT